MISLALFIAIFGIAVSLIINNTLGAVATLFWISNIDIVANILSSIGRPKIFERVYPEDPQTPGEYTSMTLLNWVALCGLIYLVLITARTKGWKRGLARGIAMGLFTYLLPVFVIPKVDDWITKTFQISKRYPKHIAMFFAVHIGILMLLLSVMFAAEKVISEHLPLNLLPFARTLKG